jgi:predicted Ser/Thr protein kinase
MSAAEADLEGLSDDKRQVLEAWLVEFDLSWDEGRLAAWVRKLPPQWDCLRRVALVEMVKIDLERRWQRGQPARLEGYLKALPELGPPDSLPADLLLAEYEARRGCGVPVDLAELVKRFPRQADELGRLVGQSPDEDVAATPGASQETRRPHDHGTDASACPPLPRRPAPRLERLGRYRILRELGRGAMGTVYLAQDAQLDRPVALKLPRFTDDDGPEVRQRFLSEARAAASIEHPNVCPVYDVGEIDGAPYLTMAYLQGQPLSQLLEGATPWSERHAAALLRQLALALQAAHARGVVHRDLKPSNIMINQRGEPVLLDFGLARRLRPGDPRLTQSGQPLGTPAYMSPEQVAGAVGAMGPGCDVYALGVILYQLLTGRLPFEGSVAEVLGQIVTQRPAPPSSHRPDLDPRLEALCLKALSKKAADRYPGMRELAAALASCLRHDPRPAARRARPRRARRVGKRLWLLLGGGGLAAVLLLAGFLWIPRSTGTIRLELDGPRAEVEVQVDGERIDSAGLNELLRLRPGKHHLLVTGKTIQPLSLSFTVARGDNPALRVHLVPRAEAADDPPPRRKKDRPRRRQREDDDDDPWDD